jgi:hypothetical protein
MESFIKLLQHCCVVKTDTLFRKTLPRLGFKVTKYGKRRYAFRPGTTKTSPLLVCHADTVVNAGNGKHNWAIDGSLVNSIALDDRLGLALLIWAIRTCPDDIGQCAMLVCDDEETGNSTAQEFVEDIRPNWLMEFDRRGTDVVTYEYESDLWHGILGSVGFTIGSGTFSDICYLSSYGVCGVNVGVGYHREHSTACHADLIDTFTQFELARKFYRKFADVPMCYEYRVRKFDRYRYAGYDYDPNDPALEDDVNRTEPPYRDPYLDLYEDEDELYLKQNDPFHAPRY